MRLFLLLMGMALLLGACAGTSTTSSPPAESAPPTTSAPSPSLDTSEPTSTPTVSATPTPAPPAALVPDSLGKVTVTDLVVRSAPGVGEDSEILEFGLTTGDLVYVIDGPVPADGYDWLLVSELDEPFGGGAVSAGWIAPASREGEAWVVPVDPACPSEISVEAFASVPGGLLLHCFGGEELTLDGSLGFCAHGDPVIQEPAWLANHSCAFEKLDRPLVSHWPTIYVHLDPASDPPSFTGEAVPLRITGRFDAPIAETCRYVDGAELTFPELSDLHEKLLVYGCRSSFVVETVERLDR